MTGFLRKTLGVEPPPGLDIPPAQEMATIDSEAVRKARLQAMRKMRVENQGRESTMLGEHSTLGGV